MTTDERRDPDGRQRLERQRLDKWLWFARVVKSRTLATRLVEAGHVRVDGRRCVVPPKSVVPGDVLTIALERQVRVLRIVATGERRGPHGEATRLFEELGTGKPAPGRPDPGPALSKPGLALPA